MSALEAVRIVPIATLSPDPRNPRTHGDRNLRAIRESLARFGQVLPVVVRQGTVVGGNGLVAAMTELGWTECSIVELDGLADVDVMMLRIALNRTAELADWDYEVLAEDFKAMLQSGAFAMEDLAGWGWEKLDIEPLLHAEWNPPAPTDESFSGTDAQAGTSLKLTPDERALLLRVVERMRATAPEITEGQAVAQLCLGYLAR
jgi:hypothetical protein